MVDLYTSKRPLTTVHANQSFPTAAAAWGGGGGMLNTSERRKVEAALDYCMFDHSAHSGLSQDEHEVIY